MFKLRDYIFLDVVIQVTMNTRGAFNVGGYNHINVFIWQYGSIAHII